MNKRLLSAYLRRLGFSPAFRGYYVIMLGVMLALENPYLMRPITRNLYGILAKANRVSVACIEKRIRDAIEYAWLNG